MTTADPRSWDLPAIPADVPRIKDRNGSPYGRDGAHYWLRSDIPYGWSWNERELMATLGPLTEATDG